MIWVCGAHRNTFQRDKGENGTLADDMLSIDGMNSRRTQDAAARNGKMQQ
jgi:hypothetical protein